MTRPPPAPSSSDRRARRHATRRLTVQIAAMVAALVIALTAAAVWVVVDAQDRDADAQLAAAVARADDVGDPPAGVWLTLRGGDGVQTTPGAPPGVPDVAALDGVRRAGVATSDDAVLDGRDVRIRTDTRTVDGGTVVVQAVLDLTTNHAERDRLVATLLAVGALGLALAVVVGAWSGARAVAPLAEALAVQRRFVADASHELRTPLTLLSTRAQLLHRRLRRPGADPGESTAEAGAVVADSAHLAAILDDLLLSVTPAGAARDRGPVDLAELARTVVDSAAGAAAAAGITVAGPGRHDRRAVVDGSTTALRRAVTALLDNAVRHARGHVRIAVTVERRRVHLDVGDDGPGVDPTVIPTMFDRFATSAAPDPDGPDDAGPARRYGLGLALVSDVAAAHGGTVSVVHRGPDTGATLRLTLPRGDR